MAGVRSYNPSVRVGNWNEDLYMGEDLIKDFLDRKEKNQLLIQKASNLLKTLLKPVELSASSDGGYLCIGDAVCLLHVPTHSVLSAHMSAGIAHEATKILPDTRLSCSKQIQPCPRNVLIIGSWNSSAKVGDPVCYEQPITFTTLPDEGGTLTLSSDMVKFWDHSKYTREQELKLKECITYKSAWRLLCFNQEDRLEFAGLPVLANKLVFINHCKTNMNLAVHNDWTFRTPFGREFEVTSCTKWNKHRVEDSHNHFMIVNQDGHPTTTRVSKTSDNNTK